MERMTDERLAFIASVIESERCNNMRYEEELFQDLKAEREDNTVLRRVNKNHLERISELEAKLKRVREFPDKWRDRYFDAEAWTVAGNKMKTVANDCADELMKALADE